MRQPFTPKNARSFPNNQRMLACLFFSCAVETMRSHFSECACLMVFHLVCGVPPAAPALAAVLFLYDGREHPLRPWEPCEVPRKTFHGFPTLVRHAIAMQANYGNFTFCQPYGVAKVGAQLQQVLQALVLEA